MRDHFFFLIPGFFTFLERFINNIENEVDFIRICRKETNLFVIAPNMRHVFERLKRSFLFRRSHQNKLYFVVRVERDHIQDHLVQNGLDIFPIPDDADGVVVADVKGERNIAQNAELFCKFRRPITKFVIVQLEPLTRCLQLHIKGSVAQAHTNRKKIVILAGAFPQAELIALAIKHGAQNLRGRAQRIIQNAYRALFLSR